MTVYGGPDIVTDGLVLHLDAANRKSYPGSGSTWYDLSGNDNNGVIKNATSFSNDAKGCLNFNAANNEEVWVTVPGVNTTAGGYNTVQFWMNWTGNASAFPMEFSQARLYYHPSVNAFGFNRGVGDLYGIPSGSSLAGSWRHIVAVFYNGSQTSNLLYVDGISQSLSQRSNSSGSVDATSQVTIAGHRASNTYGFSGKMAAFQIYNRKLSSDEVTQNYNALKGRYGL